MFQVCLRMQTCIFTPLSILSHRKMCIEILRVTHDSVNAQEKMGGSKLCNNHRGR